METKHTKGKWAVSSQKILNTVKNELENIDFEMAAVDTDGHYASIWCFSEHKEQAIANAKLIAAAPELLEALESIADILKWMPEHLTDSGKEQLQKAFDVIEKATE